MGNEVLLKKINSKKKLSKIKFGLCSPASWDLVGWDSGRPAANTGQLQAVNLIDRPMQAVRRALQLINGVIV